MIRNFKLPKKINLKIDETILFRPDFVGMIVSALFFLLFLSGCAAVSGERIWGENATLTPGWHRIKTAAVNAAIDPVTWIPLSGALVLQIDHLDEELTDYASENTPVFGSQKRADEASDDLRNMTRASYYITALLTNGGETTPDYLANKTKGLLVGEVAALINKTTTGVLKDAVGRDRPTGSNSASFPSGHASTAGLRSTLACRNIDYLPLSQPVKTGLKIGIGTLAVSTAWARVEANVHYPSDVLAGLSLGHFLGRFINDAFLSEGENNNIGIGVQPVGDEIALTFHCVF